MYVLVLRTCCVFNPEPSIVLFGSSQYLHRSTPAVDSVKALHSQQTFLLSSGSHNFTPLPSPL